MRLEVTRQTLDAIWFALSEPVMRMLVSNERARVGRMIADTWIVRTSIADLIEDWDQRLRGVELFELANAAGYPTRTVFSLNGRKTQRSFMGFERIHRADAAALMILLDRMGFRVDPSVFVESVLPTLKGLELATSGELVAMNFASARHKSPPVSLVAAGEQAPFKATKEIRTPTGYKVHAILNGDGKPEVIEIGAPKFRRVKEPVLTECMACGMSYMRGDPDESAAHRANHRKVMAVADPKPNPKVQAALADGWDGRVIRSSPKWQHDLIYERAVLFRREFHYDFVQWDSRGERKPGVVGIVFTDSIGTVLGACCFRWREYTQAPHAWAMVWIWIAPKARRTGLLTARWPALLSEFGEFHIEHPLSDAMRTFAVKHGVAGITPVDAESVD